MADKFFDAVSAGQAEQVRNNISEPDLPIGEDVMMPLNAQEFPSIANFQSQEISVGETAAPQQKKVKGVWSKISRVCMYLLFGLMPLLFLPFSAFPVEDAKIFFIALCVLAAGASWLARVLSGGHIEIPKTKLWFFALAFLLVAVISTIFSLSSSVSIWGGSFQPDALFVLLFAFMALFITSVVFTQPGHIRRAQVLLAASSIIVAVLSLLQFFGKYILFFDFTKAQTFNVFGSLSNVSVFLGLGLVVIIAMLSTFSLGRAKRIALIVGSVLITVTLLFLNASFVWLGLMLGFALAASWQIVANLASKHAGHEQEGGSERYVGPQFGLFMALMIMCAIFFFMGIPVSRIVYLPPSISPSLIATLGIGKDMFHEGVGRALFGSGPGTFLYEYLMHRPDSINATTFFGVRFFQGSSFVTTLFVSLGIFGIASLLAFLGHFVWLAFRGVSRLHKNFSSLGGSLVSFIGFIFLVFTWFLYPLSIPLVVLTFLFGGMLLASLRNEGAIPQIKISFAQSVHSVFMFSFGAIILLTGIIISAYWYTQHYAAAVVSAMGVQEYNKTNGSAVDDATSKLSLAVTLDSSNDLYLRTLSQLFTVRAARVVQRHSGTQDLNVLQQNFQQEFQSAVQAARLAATINDRDPLNWQALGDVYSAFYGIVGGSDTFALDSYQKMVDRNPKDPSAYLLLAQASVNASDALQTKIASLAGPQADAAQAKQLQSQASNDLGKAQDALGRAIALKPDYAAALYLRAQVYDRQGSRAQAITAALQAQALNPQDVGINYELGLLYYFDQQFDAARKPLEQAVLLNPSYSNARYFLGIVYSKEGQSQKAVDQFQEIQKLNPDNAQVKQILANLAAGKDALDGLQGSQNQTQAPLPQTGGAQPPTQLKK